MKEVQIKSKDPIPRYFDEEGYEYTYCGDWRDPEKILKGVDTELVPFGLELYVGDVGSPDYFVCIKKRKE